MPATYKYLVFLGFYFLTYQIVGQKYFIKLKAIDQLEWSWSGYYSETETVDSISLKPFVNDLQTILQREGYWLAKSEQVKIEGDTALVWFFIGERYEWAELSPGNLPNVFLSKSRFRKQLFRRKPFAGEQLPEFFEEVLDVSENQGYPFASVFLDSIVIENSRLFAKVRYEQGPFIQFDTTRVTGDIGLKQKFIAAFLKIQEGTPFSQQKVDGIAKQLEKTKYVSLQKPPQVTFVKDRASVGLDLKKEKVNQLDGIIGFLPNETAGSSLLITGQADIDLHNLFSRGIRLALNWRGFNRESQNLKIRTEYPNLLRSPINTDIGFELFRQDSSFLTTSFEIKFGYNLGNNKSISFVTDLNTTNIINTTQFENATQLPDFADFSVNYYGFSFNFTTLNRLFIPSSGILINAEASLGDKDIRVNPAFDPSLYEGVDLRDTQFRFLLEIEKYTRITKRFTSLSSIKGGVVAGDNLFLNDLFRVGGLTSLRGFNENFFFSDRYAVFTEEIRLALDETSYIGVFVDQAYLGQLDSGLQNRIDDFPTGFGLSLTLTTQAGLFNFVYGLGRSGSEGVDFSSSKIHFGYINRF